MPSTQHVAFAVGQDVTWGIATAPAPGQRESGDLCIVRPSSRRVLIAVIDGVGHGAEALAASHAAAQLIDASAHEAPTAIVARCHDGLRRTRGIVMTLAIVDAADRTLSWVGVGNVEAVLFRAPGSSLGPVRALPRAGVIGYQLPALQAEILPLRPGDTLILSTDGIQCDYAEAPGIHQPPQEIADRLLSTHRTGTDDALVAVVRYSESDRP